MKIIGYVIACAVIAFGSPFLLLGILLGQLVKLLLRCEATRTDDNSNLSSRSSVLLAGDNLLNRAKEMSQ